MDSDTSHLSEAGRSQEQSSETLQADINPRQKRLVFFSKILPVLLAETALVVGIWFRALFFLAFPDPFPNPDSWSYLTGTFGLIMKGQFDLYAQRTPAFPLIVWVALVVFKSFAALNIIHGILTLLSALAIGYVVRAFGGGDCDGPSAPGHYGRFLQSAPAFSDGTL